jgi:predicted anti-sigma-YlaC factor YlaD
MKKECKSIEQLLLDDLDNAIDQNNRTILYRHLESCSICRKRKEQLSCVQAATAPLRSQRDHLTIPIGLTVALKEQLADLRPQKKLWSWRFASALTMVVLLIAFAFVYQNLFINNRQSNSMTTSALAKFQADSSDQSFGNKNTAEAAAKPAAQTTQQAAVPSVAQAADNMTRAATAGAAGTAAGKAFDAGNALASERGFALYSGSIAELNLLQDIAENQTKAVTSPTEFRTVLPEILSDASVFRILTDQSEPLMRVIILAGYDAKAASEASNRLSASLKPDNRAILMELIAPVNHDRLINIFGQSLYNQMQLTQNDRQLTYLLIRIGG